jgi:hypothetical protein
VLQRESEHVTGDEGRFCACAMAAANICAGCLGVCLKVVWGWNWAGMASSSDAVASGRVCIQVHKKQCISML